MKNTVDRLTSHSFAVTIISLMLAASAAGWIFSELIPPDMPHRAGMYELKWGRSTVRIVEFFRLYDPFHSFWYSGILALFSVILMLCLIRRWKGLIAASLRIDPPGDGGDLSGMKHRFEAGWGEFTGDRTHAADPLAFFERRYARDQILREDALDLVFGRISKLLGRMGYRMASDRKGKRIAFAAAAGRWQVSGGFIFHLGLLVIVTGGVLGSFLGSTEILYGRPGDVIPLQGGDLSLVVEDFKILMTPRGEVEDYVSSLSVSGRGGDSLVVADIEVNHPLTFGGYSIYQSSYSVDESEYQWAVVGVSLEGYPGEKRVRLMPGESAVIDAGLTIEGGRFIPDFRVASSGPYSASSSMSNPALEVEILGKNGPERGWLFLHHPAFSKRFEYPLRLRLIGVEPVYYTGLQVSTNPGAPVFMTGLLLSTLGLLFAFFTDRRMVKGVVSVERLVIAGTRFKRGGGFARELERIETGIRKELYDMIGSSMVT